MRVSGLCYLLGATNHSKKADVPCAEGPYKVWHGAKGSPPPTSTGETEHNTISTQYLHTSCWSTWRARAWVRVSPVLLQVVLSFEGLATSLTGKRDVIFVRPLVDHQVVGLGEPALAVLADELAFGPHLTAEFPTIVGLNGHYGKHRRGLE